MSSTLYRSDHLAPVIRLTERRAGATLLVRVGLVSDEVVYRWVGIDEDATITECCEIVGEVFGIEEVGADAPQERLLCDVLKSPGDSTHFSHGLWSFEMQLANVYPRDESTPPSVCVAGSGAFGPHGFDIGEVNARLMGEVEVPGLRAEVREFMARARGHDFVPLLQALDVGAGERIEALPVEAGRVERDAFWSLIFALTCCAGGETAHIAESIFASLGHEELGIGEIRGLCAESLASLDEIGGERTPAEMLDIYRQLMRG
ncbi:hypothetical protein [uncultured Corynebacterium sp.]|uniref:hypothetical protein n=1 Tax=uncultured Corynebacterium sp. TaxID=159447 RepID=UPI0025E779F3|nr:hypothetical protein [uncultured Corynebacterium sp.]